MRRTIHDWLAVVDTRGKSATVVGLLLAFVVSILEIVGAGVVALSIQFATAESGATVDFPVIGDVEDFLPGDSRATDFRWLAALGTLFFIVRGAAVIGQQYVIFRSTFSLSVRLTDRITEKVLRRPYAWHLSQNSAELSMLSIVVAQTFAVRVFAPVQAVGAQGLTVVGLAVVAIAVEPIGAIAAVLAITTVVATTISVTRRSLLPLGEAELTEAAMSQRLTTEAFQAIREVKLLDLSDSIRSRIRDSRRRWSRAMRKNATIVAAPRTIIETVAFSSLIGLLAYRVSADTESALAGIGILGYAVIRILPTANNIVTHVNTIRGAQASMNRLVSALTDDEPDGVQPGPVPGGQVELPLEAKGIQFRYAKGAEVLRGVDVRIERGQSIGVVGGTGSGKSTLLDVLTGLLVPTNGAVELKGTNLELCRPAWWRTIGIVPQSITLLDASLAENVALGQEADIDPARLRRAIELAQLAEVVDALPDGADAHIGERGLRLSGGQRQRLALARALYRDPPVLFLDEATSALDAGTESAVMAGLRADREDRTLIMVAHRVSTLRYCDEILVLDLGRVVAQGTYEDLIRTNAQFRRLAALDDEVST